MFSPCAFHFKLTYVVVWLWISILFRKGYMFTLQT